MLFAIICTDKPNSLDLRVKTRPAHLAFLEGLGNALKAAGPFTTENGDMNGSLLIIEAADMAAISEIAARDPFAMAGLFVSTDIRPWVWRIKNPEAV